MVSYGMAFRTLISTAVLASHLDDPAYAIVDCRAKLDDLDVGRARIRRRAHSGGGLRGSHATISLVPRPERTAVIRCRIPTRWRRPSAVSASPAACRSWPTTRRTGCSPAGSGGCCAGWGTTRSPCSTAGSSSGRPKDGRPRAAKRRALRASSPDRPVPEMAVDVQTVASHLGAGGPSPRRRARAGTIPWRHRTDRQGRRSHSGREESFLPVEPGRAGTVPDS